VSIEVVAIQEDLGLIIFFIDEFFKNQQDIIIKLGIFSGNHIIIVQTNHESNIDVIN